MRFKTIRSPSVAEFTERKSRFIGQAAPVQTEEEAMAFIRQISDRHREASHNVYAYVLRQSAAVRCSDDKEPQGTAGVPVLNVLQKEECTDICLVVTRYFGGTLLGTGGLVRAYSHTAKLALEAAEIIQMVFCTEFGLMCDYSFYGRILNMLPEYRVTVLETEFTEIVSLKLLIPSDDYPSFCKFLTEFSNGSVSAVKLAERYAELHLENTI